MANTAIVVITFVLMAPVAFYCTSDNSQLSHRNPLLRRLQILGLTLVICRHRATFCLGLAFGYDVRIARSRQWASGFDGGRGLSRVLGPSLKTLLGITAADTRIKKDLRITALLKQCRWWRNEKRRSKREIGYELEGERLVRDELPKPGGCLVVVILVIFSLGALSVLVKLF
jgi:hypothetical protein